MDYLKTIDIIIVRLAESGHLDIAKKIKSLESSASTGSELLMSVTYELLILTNEDVFLDKLIGTEVIELKNFCWSIGLRVK
jgi:hypothetical protein